MAELDLQGKERPAEDEQAKPKPGRSERSQRRHRGDMRERLFAIFERIAERLEGRGDDELAAIIRQDSKAMVGGLDSVAKRVPGLATPILVALGILEPVLAFGRIARILSERWRTARWERANERELRREAEEPAVGDEPEPEPGAWPQ